MGTTRAEFKGRAKKTLCAYNVLATHYDVRNDQGRVTHWVETARGERRMLHYNTFASLTHRCEGIGWGNNARNERKYVYIPIGWGRGPESWHLWGEKSPFM